MPSETVKTTVPARQKAAWAQDADHFDMSQSEFVRTMVQAGRHWFDLESSETPSPDANPRGNALEDRVLDILSREGTRSFDELVGILNEDIDSRLEASLESLNDEGLIEITPRGDISLTGKLNGDD